MVGSFRVAATLYLSTVFAQEGHAESDEDIQEQLEQLRAGFARAKLYNSDECLQRRTQHQYDRMYKTIAFNFEKVVTRYHNAGVVSRLETTRLTDAFKAALPQETWNRTVSRLLLVMNLKVASTTMHKAGQIMLNITDFERQWVCFMYRLSWNRTASRARYPCGIRSPWSTAFKHGLPENYPPVIPVAFTDDPWKVFFRGLKETICKNGHVAWKLIRKTWAKDRTALAAVRNVTSVEAVRAFLIDMERGRPVSPHATHAWPQAVKLDGTLKRGTEPIPYQFIGDLAHLDTSLRGMVHGTQKPATLHTPENMECKSAIDRSVEQLTADDKRIVCKLIAVDYACFGYAPPAVCL